MHGYSCSNTRTNARGNEGRQYFSQGYLTSGYSPSSYLETTSHGRARFSKRCARSLIKYYRSQFLLFVYNSPKCMKVAQCAKVLSIWYGHGLIDNSPDTVNAAQISKFCGWRKPLWNDTTVQNNRMLRYMKSVGRKPFNLARKFQSTSIHSWRCLASTMCDEHRGWTTVEKHQSVYIPKMQSPYTLRQTVLFPSKMSYSTNKLTKCKGPTWPILP